MDDYESKLKIAMLERQAGECDSHRTQCDADMDAHGKMLLQSDYRTTNVERSIDMIEKSMSKYIASNEVIFGEIRSDVGRLKDFQLRLNTTWKTTVGISLFVGGLIGFIIKLMWGKP